MLRALKTHLRKLSKDPKDGFTKHIRKRVGARDAVYYVDPLRQMVIAMPDMIDHIRSWSEDSIEEDALRRLHAFALAYMYNPTDFLPEKTNGFFGYVDDAYLVASIYERTMYNVDSVGVKPFVESPVLAEAVPGWIEATRRLLPEVTRRIDMILDQLMLSSEESEDETLERIRHIVLNEPASYHG